MVAISSALQHRIIKAAETHLGPQAGDFVREVCRDRLETPFEALEFTRINALLKAIEQEAGTVLGARTAEALAEAILQTKAEVEAGLPGRLIGSVARVMGPAAEPFLRNVCQKTGCALDGVARGQLPGLARAARAEALPLLGEETADAVEHIIARAGTTRPPAMLPSILAAARDCLGAKGEDLLRELCRTRLEIELEEIEPESLALLADGIRTQSVDLIGSVNAAAFAQAVATALISPNVALRGKLIDLARSFVGPAGEDFLKRSCRRAGMPWEAVEPDHMMWLAEVVRTEATPLLGKKQADEFARTVRGFLTGK